MLGHVHPLSQRLDGVAGEHRHALARDHRAGIDSAVDEVDGRRRRRRARREHVLERMGARELRQRGRVHIDDTLREPCEERRPQQVHVAGADDELDAVAFEPVRHRSVARVAVRIVVERNVAVATPAASARASARAPGTFDATATTGRPASSSACRLVPSPETSTPITPRTTFPDHELVAADLARPRDTRYRG